MTDELKECPFCGNKANVEEDARLGRPRWTVGCVIFCIAMHRATKKDCIKDWNTRATMPDFAVGDADRRDFERELNELKVWYPDRTPSHGVRPPLTADQSRFVRALVLAERMQAAYNPKLHAAAKEALEALDRANELLKPFDDDGLSLGLGSNALTPIKSAIKALKAVGVK